MTPQDFTALLSATAGRALGDLGDQLGAAMAEVLPPAGITPPLRLAHFLGQTCEETGGFKWFAELGGPDYFAKYDGRADLGNSQPGDGYRFRGRGPLMLTGRANYAKYGAELGLDLLNDPDLAAEPEAGMRIAAAYWVDHGCNEAADGDDLFAVTRKINGGLTGVGDRALATKRAKAAIAALPPTPPEAPQTAEEPAPLPMPPPTPPTPVPAPASSPNAAPPQLPSVPVAVVGSMIRHGLTGVGFLAPFIGSLSKDQLDQLIGWLTGLVFVAGPLAWAWWKARQTHKAVAVALATPAPGQTLPTLSPQDIAAIAAAVKAAPAG